MVTWSDCNSRIPKSLQSCCHIKRCDENLLPQCSLQYSPTKEKYEELKASLTKTGSVTSVTWLHKLSLSPKHQFYIAVTTEDWGKSPAVSDIPGSASAHSRLFHWWFTFLCISEVLATKMHLQLQYPQKKPQEIWLLNASKITSSPST